MVLTTVYIKIDWTIYDVTLVLPLNSAILAPSITFTLNHLLLYIDPGSTSYVVQIIIGAVLGTLFFFKTAWLQVKTWLGMIVNAFRKNK